MPEQLQQGGPAAPGAPAAGDGGPVIEYPSSWRAEDRQHWDAAPEDIRKIIAAREGSWSKERDQYKQAHEHYSRFNPILERHQPLFQAEGIAPEVGIGNMLQLAHDLRFGDPATKQRILESLSQHYGKPAPKKEYLDPDVGELREELDRMRQEIGGSVEGVQKQFRTYLEGETKRSIDAFAKGKPHFDKLSPMMGKLISGGVASGLEDAYEMAAKLSGISLESKHPAPPPADVKAAQSRQALAAAGVNVRGNGTAPPGNKPKAPTLRKALEAQFDRIQARQ